MNWRCAIGLHDWKHREGEQTTRTCSRCGIGQVLVPGGTWCKLGFHDWEYGRATLHVDTLDRKHKVCPVCIHNHGIKRTRICRRCDRREIMRDGGPEGMDMWERVLPFEGIQERFPGNVGIKRA